MIFFGYPNYPSQIGNTIENALLEIRKQGNKAESWKAMNISGAFIRSKVHESIKNCDFFAADITHLNFNVVYEIGFAIGNKRPVLLTKNRTIKEIAPTIRDIGIFDTIGITEYSNSQELSDILKKGTKNVLYNADININMRTPVFLLETKHKTDYSIRITSRIKKSKLRFKHFDPSETPRINVYDSITFIAQAIGVIIQLLDDQSEDRDINNVRAAFLSGLADGMGKILYLLQFDENPIPIDYRDFVRVFRTIEDIDSAIADFADSVVEKLQDPSDFSNTDEKSLIEKLDFGSSAAENEMQTLRTYYLNTESYNTVRKGLVQLVVGRKGSGKSAIFIQIRDKERSKKDNLVLDLMPDGYQLIKFKEMVLDRLKEGSYQHTITAFWEYVLLLEISNKIIQNDRQLYLIDTSLTKQYQDLRTKYEMQKYMQEGDFSERLNFLIKNFTSNFNKEVAGDDISLSTESLTNLLYLHDIKELRLDLENYLKRKDRVWILFDNIDKGWPITGLTEGDLFIIRALIDAVRQIQRSFQKKNISVHPVIFLRNDVYELLVRNTSDRQKESKVVLDWVDPDLLKELLRLRIATSLKADSVPSFEELWKDICVSHYNGEETSDFFVNRSLFRPRFLINFINQCKSYAINFKHSKISKEDIEKGFESYSYDLLTDIGYEIQDIIPEGTDILYTFTECESELSRDKLESLIHSKVQNQEKSREVFEILFYYGFLGIKNNGDIKFIYDFNYDMKSMKIHLNRPDKSVFCINPAFWPALQITK
jgi:hypothetical protein